MVDKVLFSSNSDDWSTPTNIYISYIVNDYVDPCPLYCQENNLNRDYGNVKLFINPPYSDIKNWIEFALTHHQKYHNKVVLLVPSRTDTKWFHRCLDYGCQLKFVKGRLHFNDSSNSAPFPSVFITLTGEPHKNEILK